MIEQPRGIRLFVADLETAEQWYCAALGRPPTERKTDALVYGLGDFELTLRLGQTAGQQAGCVYWGVDDIHAEYQRLCTLGTARLEPAMQQGNRHTTAEILDPFGNVFGLRTDASKRPLQVHDQRAQEQAALRKVRSTVDQFFDAEEREKRNARKALLGIGAFLLAVALLFAALWIYRAHEKPQGEVRNPAEFLGTK
jgi:predicted enzyme related to lactoylglutathione lyase